MPTLIKRARYPGRVEHFRALIERLNIQCGDAWVSSGGETLVLRERRRLVYPTEAGARGMPDEPGPEDMTPPTRGTWVVRRIEGVGPEAAIEAFQERTDTTLLEFWDACLPDYTGMQDDALGAAFEEFAQWVIDEAIPGRSRQGDASKSHRRGAPRLEEQDAWGDKLTKLHKWERLRKKGVTACVAAQRVGVSVRTLRNWKARRDELSDGKNRQE